VNSIVVCACRTTFATSSVATSAAVPAISLRCQAAQVWVTSWRT
jgi:hypothetical protein